MIVNLRNGTEVEDTLVANAGHVEQDVGDVLQGIGDEEIETVNCSCSVLGESHQLGPKLTPRLQS